VYARFNNSDKDIQSILLPISHERHMEAKKIQATAHVWRDDGIWFLILSLPIFLMVFRRGWFTQVVQS